MASAARKKREANRLMQGLIAVSLGLHLIGLMHTSGLFRLETLTCIELTLKSALQPAARVIPRPRPRVKNPEIKTIKTLNIQKQHIPRIKLNPVPDDVADSLVETIGIPDIPDSPDLDIAQWQHEGDGSFATANDYFEMVKLKIESCKRYPEDARARHIEGRVKIGFIITANGRVSSVKIEKPTRHIKLNRAALNAVNRAAPFPRLPPGLFSAPIKVNITIIFELT